MQYLFQNGSKFDKLLIAREKDSVIFNIEGVSYTDNAGKPIGHAYVMPKNEVKELIDLLNQFVDNPKQS